MRSARSTLSGVGSRLRGAACLDFPHSKDILPEMNTLLSAAHTRRLYRTGAPISSSWSVFTSIPASRSYDDDGNKRSPFEIASSQVRDDDCENDVDANTKVSSNANAKAENPPKRLKLYPDVPVGARTVNVRGTNRSSSYIKYLRACSVDVNFDYRAWAEHLGPWRNVLSWSPATVFRTSDLRRILFPDVFQVGCVAGAITWYNSIVADRVLKILDTDGDGDVSMAELQAGIDSGLVEATHVLGSSFFTTSDMIMLNTTVPFNLTTLALGMMLAFRNQNCNNRYNEARILWGSMVNESRALSSRILSLVDEYPNDSEIYIGANHMIKCVMTFSHTLKYHLTTDGHVPDLSIRLQMTDKEVNDAKGEALRQELECVWNYNDPVEKAYVDRLLDPAVASRPLHALQEMSAITSRIFKKSKEEGGAGLHPQHLESIYESITKFQNVLGACERIYKTPIYTGAARFTSRCTWLWTNAVPFALYPILGPFATVPTSVIVALFMYGLEDVGARIEQPFNALPLWQYCQGIDSGCNQLINQHEILKNVSVKK